MISYLFGVVIQTQTKCNECNNISIYNVTEFKIRAPITSNNLSDIINIFDNIIQRNNIRNDENSYQENYIRNNLLNSRFLTNFEYVSLPIFQNLPNEYDDLPNLMEDNNIFNFMNIDRIYEDIKVILTEEQFNNQKHYIFKELNCCNDLKECLICIQEFNDDDEVTKITCNHIFHKNCIKNWVCEESNKCPICRIEVDKGIAK
jgi:hypothetical protein